MVSLLSLLSCTEYIAEVMEILFLVHKLVLTQSDTKKTAVRDINVIVARFSFLCYPLFTVKVWNKNGWIRKIIEYKCTSFKISSYFIKFTYHLHQRYHLHHTFSKCMKYRTFTLFSGEETVRFHETFTPEN